jgi:glycosyltransferase AglD
VRTRAAVILTGLAVLVCAALLLDAASLRQVLRYAAEHPLASLAAFGAYTGAFALRTFAWRPFVPGSIAASRLFSLILAAFFLNHVAPAKVGDLARVYGVAKQGVEGGRAAAGVILARLADLTGLLVVLTGAWTLAGGAEWRSLITPTGTVVVSALALWTLARSTETLSPLGRLAEPAVKLRAALRETTPGALGMAFLWAAPAWVLEAGILLFLARGLGLDLGVAGAVAATCFAVLVSAVPLIPGGLGAYEAGMVFVLVNLGVPAGPAFAAAVISHATKFLYAFAAAPFAVREGVSAAITRSNSGKAETDEASLEV